MKGGVGKTTTSVYLAALAASGRRSVTLVDADPQASAAEWIEYAADERLLKVSVVEAPTERLLGKALDGADADDVVVVDTPPAHERLLNKALGKAHVVVIPGRRHRDVPGGGGARGRTPRHPHRSGGLFGPHLHPQLPGGARVVVGVRHHGVGDGARTRRHHRRPRRPAVPRRSGGVPPGVAPRPDRRPFLPEPIGDRPAAVVRRR
nr:ParA family protein [Actinopolymorpha rutila]